MEFNVKNEEILHRFEEVNKKMDALGDLTEKINVVNEQLSSCIQSVKTIDEAKQNVEKIKTGIETVQNEIGTMKDSVSTDTQAIKDYVSTIQQQKTDYETQKQQIVDLKTETQNLLGLVNAEKLSNSFQKCADDHQAKFSKWFWWILGTSLGLVTISSGILYWEFVTSNNFFNTNLLIKTILTTPFIFFLIFAVKQYGREKMLFEEYNFKAAMTRSFEAYRKLIREEVDPASEHNIKALEFIIKSINSVYTSPMENIAKNCKQEVDEMGMMEKVANIFNKFVQK